MSQDQTKVETTMEQDLPKSPVIRNLSAACGIPEVLAALLYNRGMTDKDQIYEFLYPSASIFHSPFEMKDMDKAVCRIERALKNREKILIYGDYDADGITSTAALYLYLSDRGAAPVCYIPNRMNEGYGISTAVLDSFSEENFDLMITVDTGSMAASEVAHAAALGMDTVVTDHHDCCGELPNCCAVVNPMRRDCGYPFKGLAGVGVVFKLICALELSYAKTYADKKSDAELYDSVLDCFGDIVALGTVADVVPLTDENRYIVKKGIERLTEAGRPGLRALLTLIQSGKSSKKGLDASFLGYGIAPRINAAGRMGDAGRALDLLLASSVSEGAAIAQELCRLNADRQMEEARIFKDVCEMVDSGVYDGDVVLVLAREGWHQGVIGIAASRAVEKYGKTTILLTSDGKLFKGSGRSPKGINLTELFSESSELLEKYGGHEQAAGLSIVKENIEKFRKKINDCAKERFSEPSKSKKCCVAMFLKVLDMNVPLAESLRLLEPFGNGNPVPLFAARTMRVADISALSGGKHTKVVFEKENLHFVAPFFGRTAETLPLCVGDTVDVVFELSVNEYMGRKELQLFPKNIFLSSESAENAEREEKLYRDISSGVGKAEMCFFPQREHFGMVYRHLRQLDARGVRSVSLRRLSFDCFGIGYTVRCRLILDIFVELGLAKIRPVSEDGAVISFILMKKDQKVDLASSGILQKLADECSC